MFRNPPGIVEALNREALNRPSVGTLQRFNDPPRRAFARSVK